MMTPDEQRAVGACAVIVAVHASDPMALTEGQSAVAKQGADTAGRLLLATGIQPTALKQLGLDLIEAAAALEKGTSSE